MTEARIEAMEETVEDIEMQFTRGTPPTTPDNGNSKKNTTD